MRFSGSTFQFSVAYFFSFHLTSMGKRSIELSSRQNFRKRAKTLQNFILCSKLSFSECITDQQSTHHSSSQIISSPVQQHVSPDDILSPHKNSEITFENSNYQDKLNSDVS